MKIDDALRSLARLPSPSLRPFFSRRVSAIVTSSPSSLRAHPLMRLYWLAVLLAVSFAVAGSWEGVMILVAAGAAVAFPDVAFRAVLRLAGPLLR